MIGGGISGLAAAHRITELLPDAELALFEASDRLGGVLDTANIEGFLVERSADNFLTKLPAAVDLCRRLGMVDELLPTDESRRRALVVRGGRLLPIPDGFYLMSPRKLAPLLASSILTVRGKMRLLGEPLVPRGAHADESVASFVRRRLGNEVFERLVQPLVAGIYTADPEKLSMAATMPEFLAQERETGSLLRATLRRRTTETQRTGHFRRTGHFSGQLTDDVPLTDADSASGARYGLFAAPKNGMISLVTAIASRLPSGTIHLHAPVTTVEPRADNQWRIGFAPTATHRQSEIGSPQAFDALIVALPAHAAAELVCSWDGGLAAELSAIEYAGCAVVSLGFAGRQIAQPLDAFGFVVPQVENRRIIAASFASLKFAGRAPADHVLVRAFIGGALQPELAELPDAGLRQLALDELSDLLGIEGQPVMTDIARWPRSMPQYHVGHLERVALIEQLAARHRGLALAGNAYHGVGIPQCIESGEWAAARIAALYLPPSAHAVELDRARAGPGDAR